MSCLTAFAEGTRFLSRRTGQPEVTNGLLTAFRLRRIKPGRAELVWNELEALPISVEPALTPKQANLVFALAQQHGLTIYDDAYLEFGDAPRPPIGNSW